MIGAFFQHLVDTVWTTLTLAAVGAGVGVGSLVAGRLVGGLQGYLIAAAVGAVLMVGTYGTGYMNSRDASRLQAEKAALQHELNALGEIRLHEQVQQAERERLDAVANERLDDALKVIESHEKKGDSKDCPIAGFRDELDAIRRLQ